jgi:hypothetical protein
MLVACLALFLAIGGVGYAAATINSAAIVDNTIRSKDVRNENLRGKDVKPNTLTGADVNENSLGKVPSALSADTAANSDAVGGVPAGALTIGRSDSGSCSPGAVYAQCAAATLSMPREGRVLVTSGGQWNSDDGNGSSVRALCRIEVDGVALTSPTEEGSVAHHSDNDYEHAMASATAVTNVLPAGDHTFRVVCQEDEGDVDFTDVTISAVLLGSA